MEDILLNHPLANKIGPGQRHGHDFCEFVEIPCSRGSKSQGQFPQNSLDGVIFFSGRRGGEEFLCVDMSHHVYLGLRARKQGLTCFIYHIMKWQREGEGVRHGN